MKSWQRYWLYTLISLALLHLVRDVFQELGIKNVLSTPFVKSTEIAVLNPWIFIDTKIVAVIELILAFYLLIRNYFHALGYLTVAIALFAIMMWSIYWFLL